MLYKKQNNSNPAKHLAAIILALASSSASATIHTISNGGTGGLGSNFTMLNVGGITGGATDIAGTLDSTKICTLSACNDFAMTLTTTQPFFGFAWTAHAIRVFGPGTYTLDTDCTEEDMLAGRYDCDPTDGRGGGKAWPNGDPVVSDPTSPVDSVEGPNITFTVLPGQLGAHMLFDWGTNTNIHVPVIWDTNQTFTAATDSSFPGIDQTLIYDGSDFDTTCTGVGTGTGTAPFTQCDTTHTSSRVYNFASHDGNSAAIISRWDTSIPGVPTTSVAEPDGLRGFSMVNGPFVGQNANFSLDMNPPYTPPVAVDDASSTPVDALRTIDVLANDSDAEDGAPPIGATVTLLTASSAKGGTLNNNGDGTVDYTPVGLVLNDTDTFQYTISDSGGAVSNIATVTVTIINNDAPVANNVDFSTNEDIPLVIAVTDLDDTGSDPIATDVNGDSLTFASFDAVTAQGGSVSINMANTDLTYTPQLNFNGTDTFNFSVTDGFDNSNTATMTIEVAAQNDSLSCTDVSLSTTPDVPINIDIVSELLGACSDIDGDTITFVSNTPPVQVGSDLTNDGVGTLTYTPPAAFLGSDSFDFTATDGTVNTSATANITIANFGNFTMLDGASGATFGGTNDVLFSWDNTTNTDEVDYTNNLNFNMTIASSGPQPFFGAPWFAHHIRVFGPGAYSFEANNALCESKAPSPDVANGGTKTTTPAADDIEVTGCPGTGTPTTLNMVVGPGQFGVHMLFDYNGTFDIDVVNVWDVGGVWADPDGAASPTNNLWGGVAGPAPDPTTTWDLVSRDVNGDGVNGSPMVDGPFIGFYANFNDTPASTTGSLPPITTDIPDSKLEDDSLGAFGGGMLLSIPAILLYLRKRRKR